MDQSGAERIAGGLQNLAPAAAFNAGIGLLNADYPEILLPAASRIAEQNPGDARLAQLWGLAARASGEGPIAYAAFARAAQLAPGDALIAHSHALTALEAGKPAVEMFRRAASLAPQDGAVLTGTAAALVAEHRAPEALAQLESILAANPLWTDGHRCLAQIRGQLGLDPLVQIEQALAALPANEALHRLRIHTLLEARRHEDAAAAITSARQSLEVTEWLERLAGHVASELGDLAQADICFGAAGAPSAPDDIALLARHQLRAARAEDAAALLDPQGPSGTNALFWPYLALAWRMLGDPRHDWLEGEESLVGVYDLAGSIGDFTALAAHLRALHFAKEVPLDQSVRGGTQTDGNLLLRDEPAIRQLRKLLLDTVDRHIRQLAPSRAWHPVLIAKRNPQRIAGSWSVRLRDAGFHTDHVHSQGWLSSAFYVALPETLAPANGAADAESGRAGWLSLGESRDLVPELAPLRLVKPKPGRLVLFPSTMWHGTRPFPAGERMTVAFDIAPPKQS